MTAPTAHPAPDASPRHAALASGESAIRDRVTAPLAALALGLFLLVGAGFAGSDTLHAAAHDARHAFAFPCH